MGEIADNLDMVWMMLGGYLLTAAAFYVGLWKTAPIVEDAPVLTLVEGGANYDIGETRKAA